MLEIWSFLQEVAEMAAFTPYGTSEAAAIVACILYFMFFCCAVANYVYTNYPFYDVLIISTACESPFRLCLGLIACMCLPLQSWQQEHVTDW